MTSLFRGSGGGLLRLPPGNMALMRGEQCCCEITECSVLALQASSTQPDVGSISDCPCESGCNPNTIAFGSHYSTGMFPSSGYTYWMWNYPYPAHSNCCVYIDHLDPEKCNIYNSPQIQLACSAGATDWVVHVFFYTFFWDSYVMAQGDCLNFTPTLDENGHFQGSCDVALYAYNGTWVYVCTVHVVFDP